MIKIKYDFFKKENSFISNYLLFIIYTAVIEKIPPINVDIRIFSDSSIRENIKAVKGTTKINELALTAPSLDEA